MGRVYVAAKLLVPSSGHPHWLELLNREVFRFFGMLRSIGGDRGGTVVKVLCYKSGGCWFDPS